MGGVKGAVMAENKQYYIGIDVGGTSVKLGLFDEEGELLGKASVPTPSLACDEGHAAVVGGIEQLMGAVQQPRARKRCDHHGGQHRDRRPGTQGGA